MSDVMRTGITRRPLIASLAAVLGLGAAGGLLYEIPRVFGRRYPRTKFDDLLDQLPDRESAARLGRVAMAQLAGQDARQYVTAAGIARGLREGAGKGSIARAVDADIAQGKLVEIQGWVLPTSLTMVSMIAAEVQPVPGAA